MNRRSGFTLIELLTVAFIIAIMVAMLLPAVQSFQRNAAIKQTRNSLLVIKTGLDSYRQDFGDYPPSEPDRVNWTDPDVKDYSWYHTYSGGSHYVRQETSNLSGFYGKAALVLYLNGRSSDGYKQRHDSTNWNGAGNIEYERERSWPARVKGVPVSSSTTSAPRSGCGSSPAGFEDAWGRCIEYFRAYRNRGHGVAADVFPRAVNVDLDGSGPYRYTFPGGLMVGGYEIRLGVLRWASSAYEDYSEGWQQKAFPVNAESFLLVSPGKNAQFGDSDDVGNW